MHQQKLQNILNEIDKESRTIAEKLITEIEFAERILKDLKSSIKENGVKDLNTIKSYNATLKSYSGLLNQLEKIFRKSHIPFEGEDALEAFLAATK